MAIMSQHELARHLHRAVWHGAGSKQVDWIIMGRLTRRLFPITIAWWASGQDLTDEA